MNNEKEETQRRLNHDRRAAFIRLSDVLDELRDSGVSIPAIYLSLVEIVATTRYAMVRGHPSGEELCQGLEELARQSTKTAEKSTDKVLGV